MAKENPNLFNLQISLNQRWNRLKYYLRKINLQKNLKKIKKIRIKDILKNLHWVPFLK